MRVLASGKVETLDKEKKRPRAQNCYFQANVDVIIAHTPTSENLDYCAEKGREAMTEVAILSMWFLMTGELQKIEFKDYWD